jgi:hypothetical protein
MEIFAILAANKVLILTFLAVLSEVLGLIPSVKANSVFELVVGVLKKFVPVTPITPTEIPK